MGGFIAISVSSQGLFFSFQGPQFHVMFAECTQSCMEDGVRFARGGFKRVFRML